MPTKFIETLDFHALVDLFYNAKNRIYLSLPGFSSELVAALLENKHRVAIKVVLDNSEEAIRHGFGDCDAVTSLRNAEIEMRECKGNLVSFVIADSEGFYLFPHSRIFTDEPYGPNAIQIDSAAILLLCDQFFGEAINIRAIQSAVNESQLHFQSAALSIEESLVSSFNDTSFSKIQANLKINPPLHPDIKRMLEVYTTRFQYVELVAKNIKISTHRASLPEASIPVRDKDLRKRLTSSIKAFENMERVSEILELEILERKLKELRKKYLVPVTCRNGRNIIEKENLNSFKNEVSVVEEKLKDLSNRLVIVLRKEVVKTKTMLRNEWIRLFKITPPDELKSVSKKDPEFMKRLEMIVDLMILNIEFPPIEKLVTDFALNIYFFELTWEDLSDKKLLDELCQKGVIDRQDQKKLADFKKAVEEKK